MFASQRIRSLKRTNQISDGSEPFKERRTVCLGWKKHQGKGKATPWFYIGDNALTAKTDLTLVRLRPYLSLVLDGRGEAIGEVNLTILFRWQFWFFHP